MTNFRPTTLSPEALKVWDEAEAIIQESVERIRELTAPLRRPKPPSLKEQGLKALGRSPGVGYVVMIDHARHDAILAALEALPE